MITSELKSKLWEDYGAILVKLFFLINLAQFTLAAKNAKKEKKKRRKREHRAFGPRNIAKNNTKGFIYSHIFNTVCNDGQGHSSM